jgi:uncharacterized membrane protein
MPQSVAMESKTSDAQAISRLVNFSDGVFAFAVTLLALELTPPAIANQEAFWQVLHALIPKFIVFASSFGLVLIFWAAHVTITRRLIVFDWPTAWLNGLFLLTIALMPFASAMLGESAVFVLAWRLYSIVLIAASLAQSLLVICIMRDGGRLIGGCDWRERAWRLTRALSPAIAFGVGVYLSVRGLAGWSILSWTLIPIIMALGQVAFRARAR